MDELLIKDTFQKLYEEHKFMKECGLYNHEINKLVAEEFYETGYNKAIDDFLNKIYDVSDFVREPGLISGGYSVVTLENIEKIAEKMKAK